MVGTLLFEHPVTRVEADRCLVAFVRGFSDVMGSCLDAFALDADVSDGIHCHVLWAGRSLKREDREAVEALWGHGLVLLSHVRAGGGSEESELYAWGRMMREGQSWSKVASR